MPDKPVLPLTLYRLTLEFDSFHDFETWLHIATREYSSLLEEGMPVKYLPRPLGVEKRERIRIAR